MSFPSIFNSRYISCLCSFLLKSDNKTKNTVLVAVLIGDTGVVDGCLEEGDFPKETRNVGRCILECLAEITEYYELFLSLI